MPPVHVALDNGVMSIEYIYNLICCIRLEETFRGFNVCFGCIYMHVPTITAFDLSSSLVGVI